MNRSQRIEAILSQKLMPLVLEITDESHKHRVSPGQETHIKILAVSEVFLGLKLIQRHRLVNGLLEAEFEKGLHALSLDLLTKEEWEGRAEKRQATPPCRGS